MRKKSLKINLVNRILLFMQIIVTGSGTSFGVPVIGCKCKVCTSTDVRDTRYRPSIYITERDEAGNENALLVDVGAEFRLQALKYGISKIDAVLCTHSHADHVHGLDDLRIFSHTASASVESRLGAETKGEGLAIYANGSTLSDLRNRFSYIFTQTQAGGSKPKIALKAVDSYSIENPLKVKIFNIIPIPMLHGSLQTCGYLIYSSSSKEKKSIAYLTDCSYISDESLEIIRSYGGVVEHVIIDGLREKPHSTHCSFYEALEYANSIKAKNTWITHICHDMKHTEIQDYIDNHICDFPNLMTCLSKGGKVSPAYDGLRLFVED